MDLALDAADLARQHKLETAAVLLLGVGAFVFVFPFWLVLALLGGVVAIWSQIWNARDKWVGLTGPPVIALVGTIVSALIIGGQGHFVGSYLEAFRLYVGYYYRAGQPAVRHLPGAAGPARAAATAASLEAVNAAAGDGRTHPGRA